MYVQSFRARWAIVIASIVLAIVWVSPTVFRWDKDQWWFTKDKMAFGLDIQGGLHLVLGVDIDGVFTQHSQNIAASLPKELKDEHDLNVTIEVLDPIRGRMKVQGVTGNQQELVERFLSDRYRGMLQVLDSSADQMELQFLEIYRRNFKSQTVSRSIETIRNRIDEFGVTEPQITSQGDDRILVQLPGLEDSQRAKDLIHQTAKLDFMMVDMKTDMAQVFQWVEEAESEGGFGLGQDGLQYTDYVRKLNTALKDKLPPNTTILFEKAPNAKTLEAGKVPFLLSTTETVSGALLQQAQAGINPQTGGPIVSFSFNAEGARLFGEMTSAHVGELMAIVLDGVVQSAPNIRSAITGGSGMIEMGSSGGDTRAALRDAELIAMALRSGALPARLIQLEERAVGPSLGADAIQKGQMAGLIGASLVLLFVLIYYKSVGLVTVSALILNAIMIFAALAALGATLTLPGVAGIALTVGMAVDANVVINERIKEELRRGISMRAAVREGYDKAFSAVLDGNLTTIAICIVLMYFGTGPIRGFGITLAVGLIVSMFTSVFYTRTVIESLIQRYNLKLSI